MHHLAREQGILAQILFQNYLFSTMSVLDKYIFIIIFVYITIPIIVTGLITYAITLFIRRARARRAKAVQSEMIITNTGLNYKGSPGSIPMYTSQVPYQTHMQYQPQYVMYQPQLQSQGQVQPALPTYEQTRSMDVSP